jgi:hypothetical protein
MNSWDSVVSFFYAGFSAVLFVTFAAILNAMIDCSLCQPYLLARVSLLGN